MAKKVDDIDAVIENLISGLGESFERLHIDDDVLSALNAFEASHRHPAKYSIDIRSRIHPFRLRALHFAHYFVTSRLGEAKSNAPVDVWFQVTRILDGDTPWLVAQTETELSVSVLLTWASSAVLTALAFESSRFDRVRVCKSLASQATAYSMRFGGEGVEIGSINQGQRRLVGSLFAAPSVATWISVYCKRFEECFSLSHPEWKSYSAAKLSHAAIALAFKGVNSPLHFELSPQEMAVGCLVLGLFSFGALSADFFTQRASARSACQTYQCATLLIVFKETLEKIETSTSRVSIVLNLSLPAICGMDVHKLCHQL